MKEKTEEQKQEFNPLRKEKVVIRMVKRQSELFDNPNHVLSGGMAASTVYSMCVPKTDSGAFKQVLDPDEQAFCEKALGLPDESMSPHKKNDNFWSSKNPMTNVQLGKDDTILDLSNVEDFIRYKILLANDNVICPSYKALESRPKSTYRFVVVKTTEELSTMNSKVNTKMECYKQLGKIEDDWNKMKTIIEILDTSVLGVKTSIEWLKTQCVNHIDNDPKRFLSVAQDPLLDNKVLLKRCIEAGIVSNRSGRLFLKKDNTPMCSDGEEATLGIAAKWISQPKQQEVRLLLEAQLEDSAKK